MSACPTRAIARVGPGALGLGPAEDSLPRRAPALPLAIGAALLSSAALALGDRWASGALAGAVMLALAAYGGVKRLSRPKLRPHFVAHLALGAASLVVLAHARAPKTELGLALVVAFALASVTGLFGAVVYAVIPSRLTALERRAALAEDLPALEARAEKDVFRALSGSSDLVKALYARALRPFERAPFTGLRALVWPPHDDELEAQMRHALGERATPERLSAARPRARAVVEKRALAGHRLAHALLRGWLALHLASAGTALALLAAHAWSVWNYR